jgi:tetratricopeptide (TPR) repeat protein
MIIFLVLVFSTIQLSAQSDKKLIRKGNKDFQKSEYQEAEKYYSKALETNPSSNNAAFNLGTSRYVQENFEEAVKDFDRAASMSLKPEKEAEALYNLGNSLMSLEKYQESVEAYKRVLRAQPDNEDARYNLAYAQWKMKQQQNQQQDQPQDQQQDQQDQNQDQQKENQEQQDQQQDQQEHSEQQQQADSDQQQQQGKQQPKPQQLTKEDAERMLQALQNNEKKTMDKVNEQKVKTSARISKEKDW